MIKTKTITLSIHQLQFIQQILQNTNLDVKDEELEEESTKDMLLYMIDMTLDDYEEDIIHNFVL